MPGEPRHFVEVVQRHAAERGAALAYRFLDKGEEVEQLGFAALDRAARRLAAELHGRAGERALLLYPPGLAFVKALIGCWYAGVTPVPCSLPLRPQEVQRVRRIATDAAVTMLLSAGSLIELISSQLDEALRRQVRCLATDALPTDGDDGKDDAEDGDDNERLPGPWADPGISADTIALLQYTSGSTGDPKGVVVSHRNLLHNQRMIQALFQHDQQTSVVGWLPLYHDMGLIGNVLQPLWLGRSVTLMSPIEFMMRPLSWLQAISRYRATTSGGPNFAYELCADAATPEDIAALDLGCWTLAYNGAEPIRPATLERFSQVFAPCGFRPEAFYPCYGLAEATLIVTGGDKTRRSVTRRYDRQALEQSRVQRSEEETAMPLVSCGASACGTELRIVAPETRRPLGDCEIGELWVCGGSVAQGYWQRPELTAEMFQATLEGEVGAWLRTGDLGFWDEGELFIAGRLKDLIIIRGRNHHPHDIEQTTWESDEALRVGRAAAFTVEVDGEEELVVVQEVKGEHCHGDEPLDAAEVTAIVRANIAQTYGLRLRELVLARTGQIPKTSSGKIRRRECRTLYLERRIRPFRET